MKLRRATRRAARRWRASWRSNGECRVQIEYVTIDVGEITHPQVDGRRSLPTAAPDFSERLTEN